MVRNTLLITFAVLIDLLQAGISAGLFAIGAFPATVGGVAGGCALGAKIAGQVGCFILGGVAGIVATPLDPFLAPGTLPFAIGLGFVVNFCLDITLGTILTMWLIWQDMYYPKIGIAGFIAELIPGLNDLPAWTTMTVMSVVRKSAEEGALSHTPAKAAFNMLNSSGMAKGASLVTSIKQHNMRTARTAGTYTQAEQTQETSNQYERVVGSELKTIDGIRPAQPIKEQRAAISQPSYAR